MHLHLILRTKFKYFFQESVFLVIKTDIMTFIHFINFYYYGLNAGGTFTLEELIEWVRENEDSNYYEKLIKESEILKDVLEKEDWEIDNSILEFVIKNKERNKIKRIVNCLLKNN